MGRGKRNEKESTGAESENQRRVSKCGWDVNYEKLNLAICGQRITGHKCPVSFIILWLNENTKITTFLKARAYFHSFYMLLFCRQKPQPTNCCQVQTEMAQYMGFHPINARRTGIGSYHRVKGWMNCQVFFLVRYIFEDET